MWNVTLIQTAALDVSWFIWLTDHTHVELNADESAKVCESVAKALSEDEASTQSSRLIPFCCAKWMKWKPSGRQDVVDVISANTDRQIEQHLKAANSQTSLDGERKNAESVGFMIKLNPHNDAFVPTDADWRTQNKQSTTRIHPGPQI